MAIFIDINAVITALSSNDERTRDVAVESLGDVLELDRSRSPVELQLILDKLGALLESESSDVVTESILNAISYAKCHPHSLALPLLAVRNRFSKLVGSSIEHAGYILDET